MISRTGLFLLLGATACPLLSLAQAPDASLTCAQIGQKVSEQNAIIKQQMDLRAQLDSARPDPGDADPDLARQKARIRADRATKQANALVALGRQKSCFK